MEWIVGARTLDPLRVMTEKHDDKKLISAIEHAVRSLPELPSVFLHRSHLYALGDELSTGGVDSATRDRDSDSAQLRCRDCKCVKRAPVLDADLRAVVEESLGNRACLSIPCFGTIVDRRELVEPDAHARNSPMYSIAQYSANGRRIVSAPARRMLFRDSQRYLVTCSH
jgi:hypothetical protein